MINVERSQVRKETAWAIMYTQPGGLTGHVMLLIMLLMYTTAHHKIRKQCYEAFWFTHHLVSFHSFSSCCLSTEKLTTSCMGLTGYTVSHRTLLSRHRLFRSWCSSRPTRQVLGILELDLEYWRRYSVLSREVDPYRKHSSLTLISSLSAKYSSTRELTFR